MALTIQTFKPGPQIAGTLVVDRYGNVVQVVKNMKSASALPLIGAYYKMYIHKDAYKELLAMQAFIQKIPLDLLTNDTTNSFIVLL